MATEVSYASTCLAAANQLFVMGFRTSAVQPKMRCSASGVATIALPLALLAFLAFSVHFKPAALQLSRPPRNVYLDLGANWAQTLDLHERLAQLPADAPNRGWEVYSFEASPWIAWYVDKVVAAKNAGATPPALPFPASGSSSDLRRFAKDAGCNARASTNEVRSCMLDKYRGKLQSLKLDPRLNDSRLLAARLGEARRRYAGSAVRYTFVPAAVTAGSGWMDIRQSMLQLLIGGVVTTGSASDWTGKLVTQDEFFPVARVPTIDLVDWLKSSFTKRDNVVAKMDIEGAEFSILPELVKRDADGIIKVLAMECHHGKGGSCTDVEALLKETNIKVLKEGKDYQGWK